MCLDSVVDDGGVIPNGLSGDDDGRGVSLEDVMDTKEGRQGRMRADGGLTKVSVKGICYEGFLGLSLVEQRGAFFYFSLTIRYGRIPLTIGVLYKAFCHCNFCFVLSLILRLLNAKVLLTLIGVSGHFLVNFDGLRFRDILLLVCRHFKTVNPKDGV